MKKSNWIAAMLVGLSILSYTSIASAHVTVWPKEASVGAEEKYTVRVPVEKDVNTIKVKVEFPKGVDVDTVEPVVGWNYQFDKGSDGRNVAIEWTATSGGIKPHEFMEFAFVGANPKQPTELAWKAYQTYADGSVVQWTGSPNSNTPASVTKITAAPVKATQDAASKTNVSTNQTSTTSNLNIISLILAGIALLLSVIQLFRKKA